LINNYNVNQLKKIAKKYKLPTSGNKTDLITYIYNYLKLSKNIITIQKHVRGYMVRRLNKLRGIGLFNREKCCNNCDFFTLCPIKEILIYQFYSFKDNDDFIYGFDILSMYQLFSKKREYNLNNPYNRAEFPKDTWNDIKKIIKLSKILKLPLEISIKTDDDEIDYEKKLKFKIIDIFQKMDVLGNYTDITWFTSLTTQNIVKFVKELYDIWNYRAQLDNLTKRNICPPHGNPFLNIPFNFTGFSNFQIKKNAVDIMYNFVFSASDNSNKTLGAYYVLGALTIVNSNAADAMPWLYHSVIHQ